MKASEVYLRAARQIARERGYWAKGCCNAIINIDKECGESSKKEFAVLFSPSHQRFNYWAMQWMDNPDYGDWDDEVKRCRVLALCFMAALTEWDEKHK